MSLGQHRYSVFVRPPSTTSATRLSSGKADAAEKIDRVRSSPIANTHVIDSVAPTVVADATHGE